MSLRENAARAAGRPEAPAGPAPAGSAPDFAGYVPTDLPDIPEPSDDHVPNDVPVVVAWNRVMREVRAIDKGDRFDGGRGGNFDFRGIDRVVYHFGPAVRRHGVLVVPHKVTTEYRDVTTKSGSVQRQCDATVTWRIYGPRGDFIEAQTAGEGMDSGGRSTTKAQTIAERVLLLVAGLVPTEDADPESAAVERGHASVRSATSYRDEILDPGTSVQRLYQIHRELEQHRMLGAVVQSETGDDEALGALLKRIGTERRGGAQ